MRFAGPCPVREVDSDADPALAPGTSAAEIRGRYKDLVKRWHPDRFGGDPAGQVEASQRMREINAAYGELRRSFLAGWRPGAPRAAQSASRPPGRRLSQDELDGLVSAIGTESPLDSLLGTYDWYEDEISFTFFALFYGGLFAAAFLGIRARDPSPPGRDEPGAARPARPGRQRRDGLAPEAQTGTPVDGRRAAARARPILR